MSCSEQQEKDEGNTSNGYQDVTQSREYATVADWTGGIHTCFRIKSFIPNALRVRHHLHLCCVCFVGRSCGVKATSEQITCQETTEGAWCNVPDLSPVAVHALKHKLKMLTGQFNPVQRLVFCMFVSVWERETASEREKTQYLYIFLIYIFIHKLNKINKWMMYDKAHTSWIFIICRKFGKSD